jgi:hypothetical protein
MFFGAGFNVAKASKIAMLVSEIAVSRGAETAPGIYLGALRRPRAAAGKLKKKQVPRRRSSGVFYDFAAAVTARASVAVLIRSGSQLLVRISRALNG